MRKSPAFSAVEWFRFLPLVGILLMLLLFLLYWHYLHITPLPASTISKAELGLGIVPSLYFPFTMSSLVLVTLMLIMLGTALVNIFECSGTTGLKAAFVLVACAEYVQSCLSGSGVGMGNFPQLDPAIHVPANLGQS